MVQVAVSATIVNTSSGIAVLRRGVSQMAQVISSAGLGTSTEANYSGLTVTPMYCFPGTDIADSFFRISVLCYAFNAVIVKMPMDNAAGANQSEPCGKRG
jgi:hypothetical protein